MSSVTIESYKYPKMTNLFEQWIQVMIENDMDDHYTGTEPEKCDREFLLYFIRYFQKFQDDEAITFDDLVLKVKSLLIFVEHEYAEYGPMNGKIYWKIRNPSDQEGKYEFDWIFNNTESEEEEWANLGSDSDCEYYYESDVQPEDDAEGGDETDSAESDGESNNEFDDEYSFNNLIYTEILNILGGISCLKSGNPEDEQGLLDYFDRMPFFQHYSSDNIHLRMEWTEPNWMISQFRVSDVLNDPGGPIFNFRKLLLQKLQEHNPTRYLSDHQLDLLQSNSKNFSNYRKSIYWTYTNCNAFDNDNAYSHYFDFTITTISNTTDATTTTDTTTATTTTDTTKRYYN